MEPVQSHDLHTAYDQAVALLLRGQHRDGVLALFRLLATNTKDLVAPDAPVERKAFLAQAALQLADWVDVAMVAFEMELHKIFVASVRLGLIACQQLGHQPWIEQAATLAGELTIRRSGGGELVDRYTPSPRVLQVEPTSHCNLKCPMCPRQSMTRPDGYLSLELWQRILDTWSHRSRNRFFQHPGDASRRFHLEIPGIVKLFFMGEPLLHPQLSELIRLGREQGCTMAVQTNGALLHRPQMRRKLLEAAPQAVGISVDGMDGPSYERIRQGARWDALCQGVAALHHERQALGLEGAVHLSISTIVTERTQESESQARHFLAPLLPFLDRLDFITLDRLYAPRFMDKSGQNVVPYARDPFTPPEPGLPLCLEPMQKLNILWNGMVVPCCNDVDGHIPLGEVEQEGGVDAIWQSPGVESLRRGLMERNLAAWPVCRRCLEG